jgi:MFS family permease
MDIVTASAMAGIVQIVAVPSLIIGGRLTDRWKIHGRKIMIWIPTLICAPAFYLIGISTAFASVLIGVVLIGIFNWMSSAAAYAAGAESVDSKAMIGCALGFLSFGAAIGSLILPLLMGFVFDATGSWLLVWTVPAVVAFIGAIVAFFSKK